MTAVALTLSADLVVAVSEGTIDLTSQYATTTTLSADYKSKLANWMIKNPVCEQVGLGEVSVSELALQQYGEEDQAGYTQFEREFVEYQLYKPSTVGWTIDTSKTFSQIYADSSASLASTTTLETGGNVLAHMLGLKLSLSAGFGYGLWGSGSVSKGQAVIATGVSSNGRITFGLAPTSTDPNRAYIAMNAATAGGYLAVSPSYLVMSKTSATSLGISSFTAGAAYRPSTSVSGSWEAAVANGDYTMQVQTADSGSGAVLLSIAHRF